MPPTPDLREQIAAFLAGDLDALEAEALQSRIDGEPWVARLADEMADLLIELADPDGVPLPDGFGDRLRAGLGVAIGHPLPVIGAQAPAEVPPPRAGSQTSAPSGSARPPGRSDGARPGSSPRRRDARRARRSAARTGLGIATLALLAIVGTTVLRAGVTSEDRVEDSAREAAVATVDPARSDADAAADSAAAPAPGAALEMAAGAGVAESSAPAPDALALSTETAGMQADAGSAMGATGEEAGLDATMAAAGPAIIDLGPITTEEAAATLAEEGAVLALLGGDVDVDLARAHRDEVLRAPDFADGTSPAACLVEVLGDAGPEAVPAAVGRHEVDGDTLIDHVLVRSSTGSALDQVDVWVVDPLDCRVVAVLEP